MAYTNVPNRIVLKSRGHYNEKKAGAKLWPGQHLIENSAGSLIPHNVAGGASIVRVCQENALVGDTVLDPFTSGEDGVPVREPVSGDRLLMLLQNGQNVAIGDQLMSAGDGTLMVNPGPVLNSIQAASATLTALAAETVFSNGTYTLPANFLKVGDILKIRTKAVVIAQNSTNTHTIKVYVGSTALANSGALALAAGEYSIIDIVLTVRTIGASGTIIADGIMASNPGATPAVVGFTLASTTLDTTAAAAFTVKATQSANSAGNQVRLDEYSITLVRDGGLVTIATADEALDNSAGSGTTEYVGDAIEDADFIRVTIK